MKPFFASTSPSSLVPPFRWLPLFEGFIPFFSYNVPSCFLESSFRVSGGICLCCEGPHLLALPLASSKPIASLHAFHFLDSFLSCSYSLMECQVEVVWTFL